MAVTPETLQSFAIAGFFFTLLALLAPWVTAVPAIYNSGAVGRRSPLPNMAAALSCCVALLYGCSRRDGLVIGVNTVGAVLQAGYVAVFARYSPARRLILAQSALPVLTCVLLLAFYLIGLMDADALAYAAGACACLVPTAIVYNLGKVKAHLTMECMPHPVVPALSLISAPLWLVYAYAGKDQKLYIGLPNCFGLASAVLQLLLHAYFWMRRRRDQINVVDQAPLLA